VLAPVIAELSRPRFNGSAPNTSAHTLTLGLVLLQCSSSLSPDLLLQSLSSGLCLTGDESHGRRGEEEARRRSAANLARLPTLRVE